MTAKASRPRRPLRPGDVARGLAAVVGVAAVTAGVVTIGAPTAFAAPNDTATPIKHLVVLFDENVSFDHYFGTYPNAANAAGETLQGSGAAAPAFHAAPGTPTDIDTFTHAGLADQANPNQYKPFRFTPGQGVTCDQDHEYTAEQEATNNGAMDRFVQFTTKDKCASSGPNMFEHPGSVMGYYDGNTVAGLWNYAQHYTLSDNYWTTVFGPSTPGALNLVSGNTHGVESYDPKTGRKTPKPDSYTVGAPDAEGVGTVYEDPDPLYDDCSDKNHTADEALAALRGKNVGDLLTTKDVSWGWFQGGFRPSTAASGSAVAQCNTTHKNVAGNAVIDYSPHHNPFSYYKSTSNPHHVAPSGIDEIGRNGQANHNYDLTDFDDALKADKLPAVSFLKAGEYQDGHASYSDPLDEQTFLTTYINKLQQSKDWGSTAVVIAYDDSDGWYDHAKPTVLSGSKNAKLDKQVCSSAPAPAIAGNELRCGPGTREPLLVVSPYARANAVNHTPIEQASITRFIEDNWHAGRIDGSADARAGELNSLFDFGAARNDRLWLNQVTGAVVDSPPPADQGSQAAAVKGASSTASAPSSAAPASPSASAGGASGNGSRAWIWVVVAIVVVALVAAGGWALRARRSGTGR
ncbi:alkaline phosphatase family protein [Tsukamurella sp. 8F]|uniref:phospholipase C n=1 Tax=unclassified Tsukamurella TaxID=2633480 RepID=UPI0023B8BAD6|nr:MULTISPECIES: alkaline phosphatase family protein [unclassified Tsukamurella]MDF0532486.1 alkaline phosphatase family protein [Tsukamurella sp. 8J]MDF0589157.1 alkaline phosphatase family protein [Tsukamurella sp. 8F]